MMRRAQARQAAAERSADVAQIARQVERTPGLWGISDNVVRLPTSADVDMVVGDRGKILAAKRSDPFDLLHAAGGLSDAQHRAARRLFRLWCLRAGVQDSDRDCLPEKIDGGGADPAGRINQVMIDAGRTIAELMRGVGPVNAKLLTALISPMVDHGQVIAWRGAVERATGESHRTTQGALVRQACEALAIIYAAWIAERQPATPAADPRPFSSFEDGAAA